MLILACAPHTDETYQNVQVILEKLAPEKLEDLFPNARSTVVVDLKMAHLILGLRGSAARFGCIYCLWSRWPEHSCPEQKRTIPLMTAEAAGAAAKLEALREKKPDKKPKLNADDFYSSSGEPPMRITTLWKDIDVSLPIPTLHTMLGVVPIFFNDLRRFDEARAIRWLKDANVSLNRAHASSDFIGPECRRLLHAVHRLESTVPQRVRLDFEATRRRMQSSRRAPKPFLPPPLPQAKVSEIPTPRTAKAIGQRVLLLCSAMKNFREVMQITFAAGGDVSRDWQKPLVAFTSEVAELRVKVSVKLHLMSGHLKKAVISANGVSLAAFSEQAFEACHWRFVKTCQRFNVPQTFRKQNPESVRKAVVGWNATRLLPSEAKQFASAEH